MGFTVLHELLQHARFCHTMVYSVMILREERLNTQNETNL